MNIKCFVLAAIVMLHSTVCPAKEPSNSVWPCKKVILLLPDRIDEKRLDKKLSPDLVKALEAKGLVVTVVDATAPSTNTNTASALYLTPEAYLYFCSGSYHTDLCFDPELVGNSLSNNGYDGIISLIQDYKGGTYFETSAWSWCVAYISTQWILTTGLKKTSWNRGAAIGYAGEVRWFDKPVKAKQLIKSLSEMSIVSAPNDSTELASLRLKLTRYDFPSFPLEGRHSFEKRIDTWLQSENRNERDDGLVDLQRASGWARMMSDSAHKLMPKIKSDAGKYFLSQQITVYDSLAILSGKLISGEIELREKEAEASAHALRSFIVKDRVLDASAIFYIDFLDSCLAKVDSLYHNWGLLLSSYSYGSFPSSRPEYWCEKCNAALAETMLLKSTYSDKSSPRRFDRSRKEMTQLLNLVQEGLMSISNAYCKAESNEFMLSLNKFGDFDSIVRSLVSTVRSDTGE